MIDFIRFYGFGLFKDLFLIFLRPETGFFLLVGTFLSLDMYGTFGTDPENTDCKVKSLTHWYH
jgi:hypothetical protein